MSSNKWTLTINNYTPEDIQTIEKLQPKETFKVYQYEKGDECTPHIQAYIELDRDRGFKFMKSRYPRAHIEPARGTQYDNIRYCTKEETRDSPGKTMGIPRSKSQGKRSDIITIKDNVMAQSKIDYISDHPIEYAKYHKSIDALYNNKLQNIQREPPNVTVFYGPPGSGKTRKVYSSHIQEEIYTLTMTKKHETIWFDGYDPEQHTVLLIDDFYGNMPFAFLLRILDRYPVKLPIKGSMTNLLVTHIYITSNVHPDQWYHYNENKNYLALKRRITDLQHIDKQPDGYQINSLDSQELEEYLEHHRVLLDCI